MCHKTNRLKDNIREDSTHFYRKVIASFSTRPSPSSPQVAACVYMLLE